MNETDIFTINPTDYSYQCFCCLEENSQDRLYYGCSAGKNHSSTDQKVQEVGYHQICSSCLPAILGQFEHTCMCQKKITHIDHQPAVDCLRYLLFSPIKSNDLNALEKILEQYTIPSRIIEESVIEATLKNRPECISILLRNGSISNECLSKAVLAAKSREIFTILIGNGSNVDKMRGAKVVDASKKGDSETVKALLKSGQVSNQDRIDAMVHYIERNDLDMIQILLQSPKPLDIEPFALSALLRNKRDLLQLLLKHGFVSKKWRVDCIHATILFSSESSLKILLEDANLSEKINALNHACQHNPKYISTCLGALSKPLAITSIAIIAGFGIQYLRNKNRIK
jgi:hypothetical protein